MRVWVRVWERSRSGNLSGVRVRVRVWERSWPRNLSGVEG